MHPITEQSNPLTSELDSGPTEHCLLALKSVDDEMLSESVAAAVVQYVEELSDKISEDFMTGRASSLLLSGSGTSGRLCKIASAIFEAAYKDDTVRYNINGGASAFFKSRAGLEDDYERGLEEIRRLPRHEQYQALIAVSCGFSAPYIAGQLLAASESFDGQVVALGFNPPALARRERRAPSHLSFQEVLEAASHFPRFSVAAPVVGPEAISGSVRLKAGTCTLLLLSAVAGAIHERSSGQASESRTYARNLVSAAIKAIRFVHENNAELLADLVDRMSSTIRTNGTVHVFGKGIDGLLVVTDSAECPPTFGARYTDLVGYCRREDASLGVSGNLTADQMEPVYVGGWRTNHLVPIAENHMVISIDCPEVVENLAGHFLLSTEGEPSESVTCRRLRLWDEPGSKHALLLRSLQIKIFLNSLSTATFVRCGKVYGNYMIDLRISNAKLFDRAIGIVRKIADVDQSIAAQSLVTSIYLDEKRSLGSGSVLDHVMEASSREKVVPLAILIAMGSVTDLRATADELAAGVGIRTIIESSARGGHLE